MRVASVKKMRLPVFLALLATTALVNPAQALECSNEDFASPNALNIACSPDNALPAVAIGFENTAIGDLAIAIGAFNQAIGPFTLALGIGNNAVGAFASAIGIGNNAIGFAASTNVSAFSSANGAFASSDFSAFSTATGAFANTSLSIGSTATGAGADASLSIASTATGAGANASLSIASTATGAGSDATLSIGSTATGAGSNVSGTVGASAYGAGSSANFDNSAAFGAGATATRENEQVFGTASNTYTAPGITSNASRSFQSGPLQLVTTDADGHLASDQGAVFKGIAKVQAGVAISLALEAPSLTAHENFGLRLGWGNLDGDANAFGMSAMGVLCRGCMGKGTRLALDGGVGFSHSDFMGYRSESVVAGRAGVQMTWK